MPKGFICTLPFCGRLEVEYRVRSIRLVSIDLFVPNAANQNRTWITVRPPLMNAQATASALRALRRATGGGRADIPCFNVGCACRLSGKWSAWSRWQRVPIAGGFSVPAPNPPPARLRYRANGTATMGCDSSRDSATRSESPHEGRVFAEIRATLVRSLGVILATGMTKFLFVFALPFAPLPSRALAKTPTPAA